MNRRKFLKLISLVTSGIALNPTQLLSLNKYVAIPKLTITNLGIVSIRDDSGIYKAMRFFLQCKTGDKILEAYGDIDLQLIKMVPNPEMFIRQELMMLIESMKMEIENEKVN